MISGIYHVRFSSSTQDFGDGIAVFKDGTVNGGDHGYLYTGSLSGDKALLQIKQWNTAVTSVFGPIKNFQLDLTVNSQSSETFSATGGIVGQPTSKISISGKRLSDAA
jgi:hypothetical protein